MTLNLLDALNAAINLLLADTQLKLILGCLGTASLFAWLLGLPSQVRRLHLRLTMSIRVDASFNTGLLKLFLTGRTYPPKPVSLDKCQYCGSSTWGISRSIVRILDIAGDLAMVAHSDCLGKSEDAVMWFDPRKGKIARRVRLATWWKYNGEPSELKTSIPQLQAISMLWPDKILYTVVAILNRDESPPFDHIDIDHPPAHIDQWLRSLGIHRVEGPNENIGDRYEKGPWGRKAHERMIKESESMRPAMLTHVKLATLVSVEVRPAQKCSPSETHEVAMAMFAKLPEVPLLRKDLLVFAPHHETS